MAKDTGKGFRTGAVKGRTQSKNPVTKDWTKRNEEPGSKEKGEFMHVKSGGEKFKGVAKEPDRRRKTSENKLFTLLLLIGLLSSHAEMALAKKQPPARKPLSSCLTADFS